MQFAANFMFSLVLVLALFQSASAQVCLCANGVATKNDFGTPTNDLCPEDGNFDCASCDVGFVMSKPSKSGSNNNSDCVLRTCTCPGGKAATTFADPSYATKDQAPFRFDIDSTGVSDVMVPGAFNTGGALCEGHRDIDCQSCDDGYTLSPAAAEGSWSTCVPTTCNGITVANSDKSSGGDIPAASFGDAGVVVTCDTGFTGDGTAACGSDGNFNVIECTPVECVATQVANSDKKADGAIPATTYDVNADGVMVICDTGFTKICDHNDSNSCGFGARCGDDGVSKNVECNALLCEHDDEHVIDNACVACPVGTTKLAGDDASGPDTTCDDIVYCDATDCGGGRQLIANAATTVDTGSNCCIDCQDDGDWVGNDERMTTCATIPPTVAEDCSFGIAGINGVSMQVACPTSCGLCGVAPCVEDAAVCAGLPTGGEDWYAAVADKYKNCKQSLGMCPELVCVDNEEFVENGMTCTMIGNVFGDCHALSQTIKDNCRVTCDYCAQDTCADHHCSLGMNLKPKAWVISGNTDAVCCEEWTSTTAVCKDDETWFNTEGHGDSDNDMNTCENMDPFFKEFSDNASNCRFVITKSPSGVSMTDACKETCGGCAVVEVCVDDPTAAALCQMMAEVGSCDQFSQDERNLCQQTCGTCGVCSDLDNVCDSIPAGFDCAFGIEGLAEKCPLSCRVCESTVISCADGIQNGSETAIDCGGSCGACAAAVCEDDDNWVQGVYMCKTLKGPNSTIDCSRASYALMNAALHCPVTCGICTPDVVEPEEPVEPEERSCAAFCGVYDKDATCQCDAACVGIDCCEDFSTVCSNTVPDLTCANDCKYVTGRTCQCDDGCVAAGDCCDDFADHCAASGPSCAQSGCIYVTGQSCNCDALCLQAGDCCGDYGAVCAAPVCAAAGAKCYDNTRACQCDSYCVTEGDCCNDVGATCL